MTFNFIFFLNSEYVFLSYFIYLFLVIRLTFVWNCLRTYRPNCVIQQETSKKKKNLISNWNETKLMYYAPADSFLVGFSTNYPRNAVRTKLHNNRKHLCKLWIPTAVLLTCTG